MEEDNHACQLNLAMDGTCFICGRVDDKCMGCPQCGFHGEMQERMFARVEYYTCPKCGYEL